ncbi:MAG: NfeD family protein [Clostridia bacterium]|nr:NfeD family protein [Clostridia bacterium]
MEIWIWTIIIAVSLVVEFATMQLVSVWLALGALVGLVLALIGGIGIEVQIVVAVLIAVGSIIGLRKFALKFLNNKSEDQKAEMLIGKKSKIVEEIDNENFGTIKINGVLWTAYADKKILKNEEVEVVEVNGNKLKVKKIVIKKGE